jgi:hypothetical protein
MDASVEELRQALVGAGVDKICPDIQVDFEEVFLRPAAVKGVNPYAGYSWQVIPHARVKVAVHAVPPIALADTLPWEEWFVMDGERRHHVLYTAPHTAHDEEWMGALDDTEHPAEVLGRAWYVHRDLDPTPVLVR